MKNSSIISKLAYGNTSFLFMGVAISAADQRDMLKADVLSIGRRVGKDQITRAFLNAVHPTYAVVQGNNPTFATLWHLAQASVEVFRNDTAGEVIMESDGKRVSVVAPQR